MEEEEYWNTSDNKAYSFEDVDVSDTRFRNELHIFSLFCFSFQIQSSGSTIRISNKLVDDSISEASYDLPQNDINLDSIISYHDLQLSKLG